LPVGNTTADWFVSNRVIAVFNISANLNMKITEIVIDIFAD